MSGCRVGEASQRGGNSASSRNGSTATQLRLEASCRIWIDSGGDGGRRSVDVLHSCMRIACFASDLGGSLSLRFASSELDFVNRYHHTTDAKPAPCALYRLCGLYRSDIVAASC